MSKNCRSAQNCAGTGVTLKCQVEEDTSHAVMEPSNGAGTGVTLKCQVEEDTSHAVMEPSNGGNIKLYSYTSISCMGQAFFYLKLRFIPDTLQLIELQLLYCS